MKPKANTIVKALILVLGLSIGGTTQAASINDHLKVDPSVLSVQVVEVMHVKDGLAHSGQVAVKDVPAANEIVDVESVHLRSVHSVSVKSELDLTDTNVPKWQEVGAAVASQTRCPADHVVNLYLRC